MKYFPLFLAAFSVVMCLVLSYFLIFTELFVDRLQGNSRLIMIAVLLLYGTFRAFRMYKQFKEIKNEEL